MQTHSFSATRRVDDAPSTGVAGPGWFDSSFELRQGLEVCELWFERLFGDTGLDRLLAGDATASDAPA